MKTERMMVIVIGKDARAMGNEGRDAKVEVTLGCIIRCIVS